MLLGFLISVLSGVLAGGWIGLGVSAALGKMSVDFAVAASVVGGLIAMMLFALLCKKRPTK